MDTMWQENKMKKNTMKKYLKAFGAVLLLGVFLFTQVRHVRPIMNSVSVHLLLSLR